MFLIPARALLVTAGRKYCVETTVSKVDKPQWRDIMISVAGAIFYTVRPRGRGELGRQNLER